MSVMESTSESPACRTINRDDIVTGGLDEPPLPESLDGTILYRNGEMEAQQIGSNQGR